MSLTMPETNSRTVRRAFVYGVLILAATGLYLKTGTAKTAGGKHVPTVDGALAAYGQKSDTRFLAVCRGFVA